MKLIFFGDRRQPHVLPEPLLQYVADQIVLVQTKMNRKNAVLVPLLFGALLILVAPLRLYGQGPAVYADFNGDGFADLAIGVPGEDVGNIGDAGAVNAMGGIRACGIKSTPRIV